MSAKGCHHAKAAVCYHSSDFDGIGSGYLAKKRLVEDGYLVSTYGVNYGDSVPAEILSGVYSYVVIVDFSWSPEEMKKISSVSPVLWIDHHKTAIEAWNASTVRGIRAILNSSKAAIELSWEEFNRGAPIPKMIQALAAWDIRDWCIISEEDGKKAQYAMRLFGPKIDSDKQWETALKESEWEAMLFAGETIVSWVEKEDEKRSHHVHYVMWEGLKWAVQVGPAIPVEILWKHNPGDYAGLIGVNFIKDKWTISLRRVPGSILDLSSIAKKYGGGGHPGAAGFPCQEPPKELFQPVP